MFTLTYLEGNAIDLAIQNEWSFAHGCNCWCKMASGIAGEVTRRLPELAAQDKLTIPGDPSKLGTYTQVRYPWGIGYNLYTQFGYDRKIPQVDYDAIRNAFRGLYQYLEGRGDFYRPLVIPKIGAGLARGDWSRIEQILKDETPWDFQLYVAIYNPPPNAR